MVYHSRALRDSKGALRAATAVLTSPITLHSVIIRYSMPSANPSTITTESYNLSEILIIGSDGLESF
jgi:hypothetical protein